jgi:hypothetical protein
VNLNINKNLHTNCPGALGLPEENQICQNMFIYTITGRSIIGILRHQTVCYPQDNSVDTGIPLN